MKNNRTCLKSVLAVFFTLVFSVTSAQAYVLDILKGQANLSNSGEDTELQAIIAATGANLVSSWTLNTICRTAPIRWLTPPNPVNGTLT